MSAAGSFVQRGEKIITDFLKHTLDGFARLGPPPDSGSRTCLDRPERCLRFHFVVAGTVARDAPSSVARPCWPRESSDDTPTLPRKRLQKSGRPKRRYR